MEQQNQNSNPPLREGINQKSKIIDKKKRVFVLLLVLQLLLALFSSVLVGFLIGRNTDPYRGQIIDTIVIGPDQNRVLHVAGQVLYTDGTPYADGRVELRSEPRITTTDSRGRFFYESAKPGTHTLSVLDGNGKALAKCEFTISRKAGEQPINIQKQAAGKYAVELSVNVRFIELAVELDAGREFLKLLPEKTAALEDDGTLTAGEKKLNVEDGAVALPSGTVVLPDKTVVVPGNLIFPDNTVTPIPKDGYIGGNDEEIKEDGTVTLPNGTQIASGEVKKPDGSTVNPEEPYQIPTDKKPENPDSSHPSGPSSKPSDTSSAPSSKPTEPSEPGGDIPVITPPSSSEPEDPGTLGVEGENKGGWMLWESQSSIDLFYNRTSGPADKIQPGSAGFYRFRLKNTRSNELKITITLSEDRLHIPLKLTLMPLDAHGNKTGKAVTGSIVNGTLVLEGSIGAKTETTYQLDWEWPSEGNDNADTAAGLTDGDYIVSLQILAKERA